MRLFRRDGMIQQKSLALPTSQNFIKVKFAESYHGHKRTQDTNKSWFALISCVTLDKSLNLSEVQVNMVNRTKNSSTWCRALPLLCASLAVYKSERPLMEKTHILKSGTQFELRSWGWVGKRVLITQSSCCCGRGAHDSLRTLFTLFLP